MHYLQPKTSYAHVQVILMHNGMRWITAVCLELRNTAHLQSPTTVSQPSTEQPNPAQPSTTQHSTARAGPRRYTLATVTGPQ